MSIETGSMAWAFLRVIDRYGNQPGKIENMTIQSLSRDCAETLFEHWTGRKVSL